MPRYKDRTEAAMRRAYIGQRCRAKSRGIAFLFTFEQWRVWWLIDDRWERRGRRADQLMTLSGVEPLSGNSAALRAAKELKR